MQGTEQRAAGASIGRHPEETAAAAEQKERNAVLLARLPTVDITEIETVIKKKLNLCR